MSQPSRLYTLLLVYFVVFFVVEAEYDISYGVSKTGYQPRVLRKRSNVDLSSGLQERKSPTTSSQEMKEVASGEGNNKEFSPDLTSSNDVDFDSSGVLDVEFDNGSSDNSSKTKLKSENAEIKLNGKRLHSISEAITKLLNSGRKRLENLKHGKYSDIKKPASGPVVHAYVSDNRYNDYENPAVSKLYRKNVLHHHQRHPSPYYYRSRRLPSDLDYTEIPYNIFGQTPLGYEESDTKFPEYKKPMYLYYPDMISERYNTIPEQYPSAQPENVEPEEVERAILSNYALQQELAGIQYYSCHHNRCKHGGRCRRVGLVYKCICKRGYTGKHCQIRRKDRCRPNPCLNGGSCTQVADGYECTCQTGYKGQDCQDQTRCKYDSCHNGGTCTELDDGFQCSCLQGFIGSTCKERSLCYINPCRNGGTCLETEGGYSCVCEPLWSCRDCSCHVSPYLEGEAEKRGDPCHPNPCHNSGSCYSTETGFKCYCLVGFGGETCQMTEFCSSDPCLNDGTCHETSTGYRCLCQPEFRGKTCEKENHCKPVNPCENHGICIETEESYKCHCKIGFHGFNCEERQFCKPNPCKSGGICLPDEDTYMCTCPIGYKGKNCEARDLCSSSPCFNKGTCIDKEDYTYKCLCSQEWIGNQCEVKNPCYPNPCSNDGHCTIVDGHFECHCSIGFKGEKCQVKDLCRPNPCHHEGTCVQSGPDDFECDCKRGFLGDTCEGIDACFSNPCLFGGTCMQVENGFKCMCELGQIGQTCEAQNPCFPDPCHNSGVCAFHENGHHCQCPIGFVGELCEAVDQCGLNPCANNGTCVNVGKFYKCKCSEGYVGEHCEINSKCIPNPCLNDGTCRDIPTGRGYVCYCSIAYLGPTCEKHNLCHPFNPCKNGGTCKSDGSDIVCKCKPEYLGSHCEQINFCFGNPCKNGGICTPKLDGFECDCPEGYYGKTCDALSSSCMPSPCKNEGLCSEVKNKDGYICICKQGFLGKTCDRRDKCSPNPCFHNGTCLQAQTHRGYHCLCHKGWHGYNCQRIDHCYPNPCMNGASCFNSEERFTCQCPIRYTGKRCGVDKCVRCDLNARCVKGTCECHAGFIGNGFTCAASGDPCSPNPCENDGQCTPGHGGKVFQCACHPGFLGEKCEVTMSACKSRPCLNNGACVDATNNNGTLLDGVVFLSSSTFRCVCPKGYAGTTCDKLVLQNPCMAHPCKNGGTCYDDTNSHGMELKLVNALDYRCFCPMGYSGKKCQVPQPACQSTPCLNGGTCIDSSNTADVAFNANGYKCLCLTGYAGINCEVGLKRHSQPSKAETEMHKFLENNKVELTNPWTNIESYTTPGEEESETEAATGTTYVLSTKSTGKSNRLGAPAPPADPKPGILIEPTEMGPPTTSPAFAPTNEDSNELPDMVANPSEGLLTESVPSPVAGPAVLMPPGIIPPDNGIARGFVAPSRSQNPAQGTYSNSVPSVAGQYSDTYSYSHPVNNNINRPDQEISAYNSHISAQTGLGQLSGQSSNFANQARGVSSTGSSSYAYPNQNTAGLLAGEKRYQYSTTNGRSLPLTANYRAYGQQVDNERNNPVATFQSAGYAFPRGGQPYAAFIENNNKDKSTGLHSRQTKKQDEAK